MITFLTVYGDSGHAGPECFYRPGQTILSAALNTGYGRVCGKIQNIFQRRFGRGDFGGELHLISDIDRGLFLVKPDLFQDRLVSDGTEALRS